MKAIQSIPTWQGIDSFQKSLRPCSLDESSLSIERVNVMQFRIITWLKDPDWWIDDRIVCCYERKDYVTLFIPVYNSLQHYIAV